MKKLKVVVTLLLLFFAFNASAQSSDAQTKADEAKAKSDEDAAKRAGEWTVSLNLNNPAKEARVKEVILTHFKAIRDWNNEHPFTTVPAGINPATGNKLSDLDRQVIANSAIPKSVHENLMAGLRKDLTEDQVELVLDKYTVGKVAFTLAGYKAIVPNLTEKE